ncbi:MAG: MFS transporter [Neisseriaceae bacterium]|nr:MFS transporter [Neisseriaceae bacterium]
MNQTTHMNHQEKRVSAILSFVYVLRLLGIFLLLPIFTLWASTLDGGNNKMLVGLSFGIYGLTQAIFQLPLGIASDRWGRKNVICIGLSLFALGSFLSAFADNVIFLTIARALQGMGAVSAAVTALLADLTRDEVRTRAMSIIGLSIALTFSISLIIAPVLENIIGVSGIFILMGVLIIIGILVVRFIVPDPPQIQVKEDVATNIANLPLVFKNASLWRLNFGIFALHCAQMAMFVALPFVISQYVDIQRSELWKIYFPVTIIGIIAMVPAVAIGEIRGKLKQTLLIAIILLAIAQFGLSVNHNLIAILIMLSLYFIGLNIAEAILPSWVSKISPSTLKGSAMGVYNTAMSLGLFSGSLIGGVLMQYIEANAVFIFCGLLMIVWGLLVVGASVPLPVKTFIESIPAAWQNHLETLNYRLREMQGVTEIAFSSDKKILYLKVLPKNFNHDNLKTLFAEIPDYVSK